MLIEKEKIEKAKESIAEETPDLIAGLLNVEKWDSKNRKGCCVVHNEDTPSMIWDKKRNAFHCFGCNRNIDIIDAYMMTGDTYIQAVQKLFDMAGVTYAFGEVGVKKDRDYRYPHLEDCGSKEKIYQYLGMRGISPETVDLAGLTQDDEGNICFNYVDTSDVLTMVKKRPSHKVKHGENKNWCQQGSDTAPLLFNMNRVNTSAPLVITEGECMKGDSEILTPRGWVRLDAYKGERVLQINSDLSGEFVDPVAYVKHDHDGVMCEQHNKASSICVTANHNVVYMTKAGEIVKVKAIDMPKSIGRGMIPCVTTVNGSGIPLTNEQIALYLAVSADCTIDVRESTGHRHSRFAVTKDRKYQRLKYLLEYCGIDYYDTPKVGNSQYKYLGFSTPDFIKDKRLPDEWIELATIEQRKFIIEEMTLWDGNKVKTRKQYEYATNDIHNATIMQIIAHTCGYSATIIPRKNNIGSWYKVAILLTKRGVSHKDGFNTSYYNGMVYCVTVPSGMILVRQNQKVFITGNCDTLALIECGITNAVSIPLGAGNTHWIEHNWEWLEQFDSIIVCFDNDEAGIKARKEVVPRLGSWRTKYVEIPPVYTKEDGTEITLKDVNEVLYYIGQSAVVDLVAHAEDPGVPSVVNVSDIQDVDLDEIDGITTGIKELDTEMMKLFYGTLTIVSGLPGSGKSSFLSQIMCQALDQDKPAWMFCREMPCWMIRNWLNYIMSGGHHIKEYEDSNGAKYYKTEQIAKSEISEYYDKKWFLYRDDWSNKFEDVLASMEDSVRKYGTKLLIVDNLMMLDLGQNEDSQLLKQTECVEALIKFAMKYSVAVVLVAHPRKTPAGEDIGLYDIAGSSNIVNLAHRTIGLKRINKEKEKSNHDVCLTLIKDRMRGRAGKKVGLYYDVPTRRFYTSEQEYNYQYQWDKGRYAKLPYPHEDENEVFGEVNNNAEKD